MTGRFLRWSGGVVAGVAVIGLGVYFAMVGLDEADKLASVLGAFIGLAGFAVAVYGTVLARRSPTPPPNPAPAPSQPATPAAQVQVNAPGEGGNVNAVMDGTMNINPAPPPPGSVTGPGGGQP